MKISIGRLKELLPVAKFQSKKQRRILSFHRDEYYLLSQLLEKGYPFYDALACLNKANDQILHDLEKGVSVREIVMQNSPKRFAVHFSFFFDIGSLSQAIQSALRMEAFEKDSKKKLWKKCSYPLFLLIFAFVILFYFTNYIIPQMLQSFSQEQDFSLLLGCMHALQGFTMLLVAVGFLSFFIFLISEHVKDKRSEFIFHYANRLPFCGDFISYQLAGYLQELEQKGIPTQKAMQYLSALQKDCLLTVFIKHLIIELETGKDLLVVINESNLLSSKFKQMFRVGAYDQTLCEMLSLFMKQQEIVWDKLMQKIAITIQCVAYIFIAALVIIVYQIMLLPLSMLNF